MIEKLKMDNNVPAESIVSLSAGSRIRRNNYPIKKEDITPIEEIKNNIIKIFDPNKFIVGKEWDSMRVYLGEEHQVKEVGIFNVVGKDAGTEEKKTSCYISIITSRVSSEIIQQDFVKICPGKEYEDLTAYEFADKVKEILATKIKEFRE